MRFVEWIIRRWPLWLVNLVLKPFLAVLVVVCWFWEGG